MAGATAEIDQLKAAMAALEAQRAILGDAIIESALGPMREKLAALEAAGRADQQRKQATVLFADVSGFTAMSETMDAEEVAGVMNDLWAAVDRAITDQGGHIDKHIGDAVMALWGADKAREDDPERAVRAALAMQAAITHFCETRGAKLAMRIGLNTGPVVLGAVGTTGEFTAMGDAVNLASRLEHAAPVGGILIGHDTYRQVRGIFDVLPQEPLSIKGKAEPVQTYVVQRAKPRAFRLATRGVEGIETKMIGRDAELDTLKNAYLDAMESAETRVAIIIGEAGVGKSRLLYEFDNWVELRPETIWYFKGRATPNTQNVPYALFRDLFANRFDILESDAIAVALDKFRGGMAGALTPEQADVVGHWLGFDFSSSEAVQRLLGDAGLMATARAFLMRYFRALSVPSPSGRGLGRGSAVPSPTGRGLGRGFDIHEAPSPNPSHREGDRLPRPLGEGWGEGAGKPSPNPSQGEGDRSGSSHGDGDQIQGPTVIFLEDLHWADDSSLDLAAYLATTLPEAQLLIVAVTRPSLFERRPNWGEGQAAFARVPLKPLSRETSRALVDEILQRVEQVPDALRELIINTAEGNPFYVEELVKMLIEQGVIERGITNYELRIRNEDGSPPATRHSPLAAGQLNTDPLNTEHWIVRTDKLATLKVPPTLTALLQARLDGLPRVEREALQRASVVGRLFWDDAVAELLEVEREAAGATLERVRGRELIFRREHSAFAGAGEYIFKHALLRDVAYETVLLKRRAAYHGRAARWLEHHAGERRDEYLTQIAEHYIQAGEGLRAAALLEKAGQEAVQVGADAAARPLLERALALRQAAGESDGPAVVTALVGLGLVCNRMGDYAASSAALERGLAGARAADDRANEAEALAVQSWVARKQGDYDRSRALAEEALPLGRALGGRSLARALNAAAEALWALGDLDAAESRATESLEASRAEGDLAGESRALNVLSNIASDSRDLELAREFLLLSLEAARRANLLSYEGVIFGNLGDNAYRLGDYAAARAYGRQAGERLRELGMLPYVVLTLGNVAQADLKLGDDAAARRGATEALRLARSLGALPLVLLTVFLSGQILAETGQAARALRLYGLARAHPALEHQTKLEIDEEVARLGLPAAEVEAGLATGAELDLDTVVEEILEEKW